MQWGKPSRDRSAKPCRIYEETRERSKKKRCIRSTMATDVEKSKEFAQDRTDGGEEGDRRGGGEKPRNRD